MGKTLQTLQTMTTLVVDSSDFAILKRYPAQDATTNPSLVLQAAQNPLYRPLLEEATAPFRRRRGFKTEEMIDAVLIAFGLEILKIVPGRVSTEVDATLSFDKKGSLERAKGLIALYEAYGIKRERILIKLASTWEGLQVAEELEKEGIHCNMTLLFAPCQAEVAAQVRATLISPFVGRILDWHKTHRGFSGPSSEDPGVLSVRAIYKLLKGAGSPVEVMGASFRSVSEILELAGCDLLTISPKLFDELERLEEPVTRKLFPPSRIDELSPLRESEFRFLLNEDEMATDKLGDGIRKFSADTRALEKLLKETLLN